LRACLEWIMGRSPGRIKTRNIKLVFAASQLSIKEKSKEWLARNQNIVSERRDMFTQGLLFSVKYHYYNSGKHVGLTMMFVPLALSIVFVEEFLF
jgi:hypothetical protein